MTELPVSELAKILMIGVRRVQQLAKEGIIPKTEKGRYALIPAVQGYIRFLQERSMSANSVPEDYRTEKARLTKAQAEIAEIELAQKRGELAPVADFEKATEAIMRTIRTNMMNIPQRAVTRLLGETDETTFKDVLQDEIRQALETTAGSELEVDEEE